MTTLSTPNDQCGVPVEIVHSSNSDNELKRSSNKDELQILSEKNADILDLGEGREFASDAE